MIRLTSVVLPAPVGPTMATVLPGSATSDRSLMSVSIRVVRERHVVELDSPRGSAHERGGSASGDLLVRVQQLEDPLGRGDARLQDVHHRRDLRERLRELARVLDERLDVAERHRARTTPAARR